MTGKAVKEHGESRRQRPTADAKIDSVARRAGLRRRIQAPRELFRDNIFIPKPVGVVEILINVPWQRHSGDDESGPEQPGKRRHRPRFPLLLD